MKRLAIVIVVVLAMVVFAAPALGQPNEQASCQAHDAQPLAQQGILGELYAPLAGEHSAAGLGDTIGVTPYAEIKPSEDCNLVREPHTEQPWIH
jgi:hypothetical protein